MLSMTNHDELTNKPLDLPVARQVLREQPLAEQEKREPEFELTPLNPKL
jgi:hypothetical protein